MSKISMQVVSSIVKICNFFKATPSYIDIQSNLSLIWHPQIYILQDINALKYVGLYHEELVSISPTRMALLPVA